MDQEPIEAETPFKTINGWFVPCVRRVESLRSLAKFRATSEVGPTILGVSMQHWYA